MGKETGCDDCSHAASGKDASVEDDQKRKVLEISELLILDDKTQKRNAALIQPDILHK